MYKFCKGVGYVLGVLFSMAVVLLCILWTKFELFYWFLIMTIIYAVVHRTFFIINKWVEKTTEHSHCSLYEYKMTKYSPLQTILEKMFFIPNTIFMYSALPAMWITHFCHWIFKKEITEEEEYKNTKMFEKGYSAALNDCLRYYEEYGKLSRDVLYWQDRSDKNK